MSPRSAPTPPVEVARKGRHVVTAEQLPDLVRMRLSCSCGWTILRPLIASPSSVALQVNAHVSDPA